MEAFKKGEGGDEASVQTAITLMEEALALNDEPGNGYLPTTFKAKLEELQKEPKRTDAPPAGTRKTLEIDGIEYAFRYCPAGTFQMGSPESEKDRFINETQHDVTLTNGFWTLETEVTQAMWQAGYGFEPELLLFVGQRFEEGERSGHVGLPGGDGKLERMARVYR